MNMIVLSNSIQASAHAQALGKQRAAMHAPGLPLEGLKTPQGWVLPRPKLPPILGGAMPSANQEEWTLAAHGAAPSARPELQSRAVASRAPPVKQVSKPDLGPKSDQAETVEQRDRCVYIRTPLRRLLPSTKILLASEGLCCKSAKHLTAHEGFFVQALHCT